MAKTSKSKVNTQTAPPDEVLEPIVVDVEDLGSSEQPIQVSDQLEKAIKQEVARFEPFENKINELKEKYSGLTIVDVEDREGYEAVRLAVADLRSIRTGTDKDKALIKAPFLAACKSIEDKAKWIIKEVELIENPLAAQKKQIDAEKDKIKEQKKADQESAFINRTLELIKYGAQFNGSSFVLGDLDYSSSAVKEADKDVYETLIAGKYKAVWEASEIERKKAQDKIDEDARLLKQQQEDFKKQQDELIRQQKELKDQQDKIIADKKKADDAIFTGRVRRLKGWGYSQSSAMAPDEMIEYSYEEILNFTDTEFDGIVKVNDDKIAEQKENDAKKERIKQAGISRKEICASLGMPNEDAVILSFLSDEEWKNMNDGYQKAWDKKKQEEWVAKLKKDKDDEDFKKQQELDASSDKVKWDSLTGVLGAVIVPEFKSPTYRTKAKAVRDFLADFKSE